MSIGFDTGGTGLMAVLSVSVSVSLSPAKIRSIIAKVSFIESFDFFASEIPELGPGVSVVSMSLSVSILYSGDSIVVADRLLNQATTFCSYLRNLKDKNIRNTCAKDALNCGMLCIVVLVLVGDYYNLLRLLKINL